MPQPPYSRRLLTRGWSETARFTKGKLLTGFAMAVIVRFAYWEFGRARIWRELIGDVAILVSSYALVFVASFLWNLFRATAILDAEHQAAMEKSQAEWRAQMTDLEGKWRVALDNSQAESRATLADYEQRIANHQQQIKDLKDKLAGPDKARTEHIRGLLNKLSANAKQFLGVAVLHGVFDPRKININGKTPDGPSNMNAARECEKAGLLTIMLTEEWGDQHRSREPALRLRARVVAAPGGICSI